MENVETEVSNLKDAFTLTVSETVKGVNKTESSLQAQENVRYLNEHQRKANELERIANENARISAEVERKDTFNTLVDSEVIEQTVAQEVANEFQQIESTYANRLLSTEQQLADTLNKSAITLTHMFADNTARDAYFVAHPTELIELQFIKVGTDYQQYIEGVWTDSVPIVSEQLSATNQPIVDTGNYFATDKTNDALQELGAHKVSIGNPHGVTKAQVGLGNADNTSDANKPVSSAQQTALDAKANKVQEAWITPTLLNGFTGDVRYRKTETGMLQIVGYLKSPTVLSSEVLDIFTLPIAYIPVRFSNSVPGKFEIIEDAFYTFRAAKVVLSPYTKTVTMYAGQNSTSWHFNIVTPLD